MIISNLILNGVIVKVEDSILDNVLDSLVNSSNCDVSALSSKTMEYSSSWFITWYVNGHLVGSRTIFK